MIEESKLDDARLFRHSASFAIFANFSSRIIAMARKLTPNQLFRLRLGSLVAKHGADGRLSANAFTRKCGLTSSRRLTDWLEDGTMMPSADNLRRISDALGVSVDWLLGFDVPMMRGATMESGDLENEVALHVEHAIAAEIRDKPYAFYMANQTIDGAELLKSAVSVQMETIEDAWREATVLTESGIRLLTEVTGRESSRQKIRSGMVERMILQAAIFRDLLKRGSKIVRSFADVTKSRRSRPLLELGSGIDPGTLIYESPHRTRKYTMEAHVISDFE